MAFDKETTTLLRKKGVRCICQLCDCGRPHKHPGCVKDFPNASNVFQQKPVATETSYQKMFGHHENTKPVCSFKPAPRPRNPNPPLMDFRTINRTEFHKHNKSQKRNPIKRKEEYEGVSGPFDGDTIYNTEFKGHKPMILQITRPEEIKLKANNKMDLQSTYRENFYAKEKSPQVSFRELPSLTYSMLYPNRRQPVDKKSFKNAIHSGAFAPKLEMCKPKESTVQIGTEGEHDHSTTHRSTYKYLENPEVNRVKTLGSSMQIKERRKFASRTQAQDDFKGFGSKMPKPRKIITPPPETLEISMNNTRYFDTTNRSEIKISWDPESNIKSSPVKQPDNYSLSEAKFEALSVSGQDFKQHPNICPSLLRPPEKIRRSDAKFHGETSYQKQFTNYEPAKRVRYGDFHEGNFYLKPVSKFHQNGSVMTQDYHYHKDAKPRSPIKPDYKRHATGGSFHGNTSYGEAYKPKETQPCQFSKLIADINTRNILAVESKKDTLPSINRRGSTVAII